MHLTSAIIAGTLALQASAFLIPLEISKAVVEAKGQIESIASISTHTVELDCPNCPFSAPEGTSISWDEDDENRLVLNFSINHDQSLRINDRNVFSLTKQQSFSGPLNARQSRTIDSLKTEPVRLGWALEVLPPVIHTPEPGMELYTLQFTVLDVEGVPVEMDSLKVDILKHTSSGSEPTLSIVKISPVSFSSTPGAHSCQHVSQWSLCRLRAIITSRLHAMLEAAKAHAGAIKSVAKGGCRGKHGPSREHNDHFGGHRSHGQHGPHHYGHHHHQGHRVAHLLRQTLRFFIVPALLGVIGGLLASAIGMLVGQLIVYIWTRFHHGGQRGNIRIVEVAVEDDEKVALVVENEGQPPPQYSDVESVVVEEKH